MKKRLILNFCMVLTIILVAVCGVMAVGSVKGWFGKNAESEFTVSTKSGIAMIERNGIAYELGNGMAIQPNDKLYTKNNASVTIAKSDNPLIYLGSNAEIVFEEVKKNSSIELLKGEALVDARGIKDVAIFSGDTHIALQDAVATVSTQAGASMIFMYSGMASLSRTDVEKTSAVQAGEAATVVKNSEEYAVSKLLANSLSNYQIQLLADCGMDEEFCFTETDLVKVQTEREEEILKAQQEALKKVEEEAKVLAEKAEKENNASGKESIIVSTVEGTDAANEDGYDSSDSNSFSDDGTIDYEEDSFYEEDLYAPQESLMSCTIEIRCDTILSNMENLTAGKEGYVPSGGTIVGTTSVSFSEGETVFEVLQRVCSSAGIQLEYSWTPMYDSYYIEGINHLYEFDCGSESGWMYKVNGWFPNYGCSSYELEDGDTIVWCYTCNGLGADVGGSVY